ncbi:MAG: hypothetical protein ABEJ43_02400 [Haloferacaceae archaeon]
MEFLAIPRPSPPPDADLDGFDADESTWRLNLDRYGAFVAAVTGIRPGADVTAADCYRIGNRLEAFIAERKRTDDWTAALVEEYPDVDSLDQIHALARFFRHCHTACLTGAPAPSA